MYYNYIPAYLAILNIILFLVMAMDKKRAVHKKWRISERALFLLGLAGGAVGGLLGMFIFRHKTKKPIFYAVYLVSILIWGFSIYFSKYRV